MSTMRFVCGSCDYSTDLTEKLRSHYMAIHQLSEGDASVMVRSNGGELTTGQEWFSRFYEYVRVMREEKRRNPTLSYNSKAYLEAAKRAAGLEGVK